MASPTYQGIPTMSETLPKERAKVDHKAHADAKPQAQNSAPQAAAAPAAAVATIVREIGGMNVTLPLNFAAGQVMDATMAAVLNSAYHRQFANNMNANIKARSERLAKATTDAERAENAPLTATDIAAAFVGYAPAVGDTPRQSTLERQRQEAGWKAWVQLVADHNADVAAGLIPKAKGHKVTATPLPSKTKGESDEAFKLRRAEGVAAREKFVTTFLSMPQYADRVQAQLDLIQAAASKEAKPEALAGESLL